jgi:hypothetical protein
VRNDGTARAIGPVSSEAHALDATDYPHPDHPSTWVEALARQVEQVPDRTRTAYLGANVRRVYGL